jgi:hypothetical protein
VAFIINALHRSSVNPGGISTSGLAAIIHGGVLYPKDPGL